MTNTVINGKSDCSRKRLSTAGRTIDGGSSGLLLMTNCGIVLGVQGNGPTKLRALRDYYYPFMKARARECFGHVGLFVCLFSFLDSCFYFF